MSDKQNKTWYRPDIDGLRAIAVVAVILFHAKVPGFAGGFVGVDVFFVISGFLITSIIVRQLQAGTFSFSTFWARRVRRIIPVLAVVLLTTAAVGYWFLLFPLDYLDFGQSLLAQAFFLSNIFFLRKSDYFAGPAEESPLLHTWSLAIEEQFYLVFPLILFLLWRMGRRVALWSLGTLATVSLVWCQYLLIHSDAAFSFPGLPTIWAAADNATAAFYLLPTRAFELLIGALLAISGLQITGTYKVAGLSGLGIGLLIGSIVWFSEETLFPGMAALVPTFGTALLILVHTQSTTLVSQILSWRPVVWVGLLSYSLYLWHWPVFVFGKQWFAAVDLSALQIASLLVVTAGLSIFSYFVVEQPCRKGWVSLSNRVVLLLGTGLLSVLASLGWFITAQQGLPERAPDAAKQIALAATDFGPDRTRCFVESRPCRFGPTEGTVTHVIIGDSHGGAILPAIKAAAESTEVTVETYLSPGCTPLVAQAQQLPGSTCDLTYQAALDRIAQSPVTAVLLVSRWAEHNSFVVDSEGISQDRFAQQVAETAALFTEQGVSVTVFEQVPEHAYFEVRQAFAKAVETNRLPLYSLPRSEHETQQAAVSTVFAQQSGVSTVDPAELFCTDTECDFSREGTLLYQDKDHLNQTGAQVVIPLMEEFLTTTQ